MGMSVTEQLRRAIEHSGQSCYAISQETGIAASILSRFLSGSQGLRSHNMDALAEHLGLELAPKRRPARGTRKGK